MDRAEVVSKLKAMIEAQDDVVIESPDQTLDIDSYTMMMIITYVKDELGVELDMEELDFDAFKSVNAFADMVMRRKMAA